MSNFSSAAKVSQLIRAGDPVEFVRSGNRKLVLDAANCRPPFDDAMVKKMGLTINVDWGEFAKLLTDAIKQMLSAFTANQYYFAVTIPDAPKEHQSEWEAFITDRINLIMERDIVYYMLQWAKWSSVAKFGVGIETWRYGDRWRSRFCPLQDIRIATDTTLDFENLNWYAQRIPYTVYELFTEVTDKGKNNHWRKEGVAGILRNYKEMNFVDATQNINFDTDREKFSSLIRQNGGFYGSNALPTIPLYHFYFEDDGKNGQRQWFMRVVPEEGVVKGANNEDFLWQSDEPVANSVSELIHCQYGDLSFDDPPTFGGVRGLGDLLYEPCYYSNLTRCRAVQHLHDQFNILLRTIDPQEKARAAIQVFQNLGVLKPGVSIVPEQERHQIKTDLLEFVTAQMKQLASEASSSYTQQADTGTQKEQTAFETRVKAEQVNAMTSGIILKGSRFEDVKNREICRRFCLNANKPELNIGNTDPDIIEFQGRCRKFGIPSQWLDINQWVVRTVTPIGMGNPVIAQAAVEQLQKIAPKLSPEAQNEINHETVLVYSKDPRKARRWAPIGAKPTQSDASREAIGLFATLLVAAPGSVPPPQNNYIDQIEVLLPLLAGKIVLYTNRNNMADAEEAMGLNNVLTYIGQAVQALGQDPAQKERVKKYTDSLAQLGNEVKALAQRGQQHALAEAKLAQTGQNGEAQAKIHNEQVLASHKMTLNEIESRAEQRRKDRESAANQRRLDAAAYAGTEREHFKALAGAHTSRMKAFNEGGEE
jgi:hypothetical protein